MATPSKAKAQTPRRASKTPQRAATTPRTPAAAKNPRTPAAAAANTPRRSRTPAANTPRTAGGPLEPVESWVCQQEELEGLLDNPAELDARIRRLFLSCPLERISRVDSVLKFVRAVYSTACDHDEDVIKKHAGAVARLLGCDATEVPQSVKAVWEGSWWKPGQSSKYNHGVLWAKIEARRRIVQDRSTTTMRAERRVEKVEFQKMKTIVQAVVESSGATCEQWKDMWDFA